MAILHKIKNIILMLGALCILGIASWGYYRFHQNPLDQALPLPYKWAPQALPELRLWNKDNQYSLEEVQVLIAGDEFAQEFWNWRDPFAQELSLDLSSAFRIGILGKKDEGIHRISQRFHLMPKTPKIIILMVGGAEGSEINIDFKEYEKIKHNLNLYQNSLLATAIELLPPLSRFIFRPIRQVELGPTIVPPKGNLLDYEYQMLAEIKYLLFKAQLEELVQYLQKKGSQVVLTTLPIRLEQTPHGTCVTAQDPENTKTTAEIWELLKQGRPKDALALMDQKSFATYPGPLPPFLRGVALNKTGEHHSSIEHFLLASALDCHLWRANFSINSIIRLVAKDNDVPLFDYEQWLNLDFGKNPLFITPTVPHPFYLERGAQLMGKTLRTFLRP